MGGAGLIELLCGRVDALFGDIDRAARAQEDGRSLAREAGKSNATTIIERIDGSKTPLPGRRIVCSERFCGFHDGKTATVISLEGVQSIQSSHPQKPPPDVRRSLWDRMRGK